MIIVELNGGLGNQLFQYARGYSLAKEFKTELKIDLKAYLQSDFRSYELPTLGINPPIISKIESYRFRMSELFPWKFLPTNSLKDLKSTTIVKETKAGTYTPELFLKNENLYLRGYWQTEKYFQKYSDELKSSISYQGNYKKEFTSWTKKIANLKNSVAIHIRRTDYISNPKANATHGTLTWEYYKKGLSILKSKFKNINVLYFSDDPQWVSDELIPQQPGLLINTKISEPAFEMMLMAQSSHFIIANSSYSWWASYLGKNPNKQIIAPKKWFKASQYKAPDIIPPSWIKI